MMKIACLTPTYKRPECLPNAAACFVNQDIHLRNCNEVEARMFVLDDANQYATGVVHRPCYNGSAFIDVLSHNSRHPSLPDKFQALVDLANEWGADAYVVWEDDDVFLPWHLSNIYRGFNSGARFYRTPEVWSNYNEQKQGMHFEGASGRFHSSWAFTRAIYEETGGYGDLLDSPSDAKLTRHLNFDQRLGARLRTADPKPPIDDSYFPAYVYRWGNSTYHGSAFGDNGYADLWESLGRRPAPFVGQLDPQFDSETEVLWRIGLRAYKLFLDSHPELKKDGQYTGYELREKN